MTHIQEQYLLSIHQNGDMEILDTHREFNLKIIVPAEKWTNPSLDNFFLDCRRLLELWYQEKMEGK